MATRLTSPISNGRTPGLTGAQPRYLQLAQTLYNEIESGKYPIGALVPTEFDLCEQFGVSRFTAREAVKRLVQLGMVVRQPGVGTRVCARTANASYNQNITGVADLYQYATDTTLSIDRRETVEIEPAQAEMLEGSRGETWLHMHGRRFTSGQALPICVTELWLHPAFRSIKGLTGRLDRAVHAIVEEQFGESIGSVEQEIRAVLLDRDAATSLDAPLHSAGLKVVRRYRNRRGQLIEHTTSVHPADRFHYTTTFQRDWQMAGAEAVAEPAARKAAK